MAEVSSVIKECNQVFKKYGYRKVTTWQPTYDYVVPPRKTCAMFDENRNRCASLKRTYCQYEDCRFYKKKEEDAKTRV